MAVSEAAEQGGDLHLSQRVWGRLVPIPQAGAPRLHHPDCAGLGQLEKRSPRWGLKPEAASQQWATICVSSTLESWLRLLPLKKTLDDKGREDASAAGPHPGVLVAVPLWAEPLPGQAGNPQAYLAKTKGCTNIGASESARGATHSP